MLERMMILKIKVNTLPIENIELEFEDGVSKNLRICNYMFALLDQEFEEGCTKTLFTAFKKPYEYGAKVIYAGLKAANVSVTLEEAMAITLKLSVDVIGAIIDKAMEQYSNVDEESKKKIENLTEDEKVVALEIAKQIFG